MDAIVHYTTLWDNIGQSKILQDTLWNSKTLCNIPQCSKGFHPYSVFCQNSSLILLSIGRSVRTSCQNGCQCCQFGISRVHNFSVIVVAFLLVLVCIDISISGGVRSRIKLIVVGTCCKKRPTAKNFRRTERLLWPLAPCLFL